MNLPASVVWLRQRVTSRDVVGPVDAPGGARTGWGWVAGLAVAVLATLGALGLMRHAGLEGLLGTRPSPVPQLSFERLVLRPGEVSVTVRNTGREPLQIAQVTVDDAFRVFSADPGRRLARFGRARLRIPYPWIAGDPLHLAVVDSTGLTFTKSVEVAAETPAAGGRTVAGYVILGSYVGVIPVFLGLLFLPALSRLGRRGLRFLLGFTGGLLVFLAVEALDESMAQAGKLPSVYHGTALVFAGAAGTFAGLAFLGRRRRARPSGEEGDEPSRSEWSSATPLGLALLVAIGIGFHNFGEGLAIGSAHAQGEIALGTALVVGFALHNLTEAIGIAAPTMHRLPDWRRLAALGAVAGLPTVAGTLVGGLAYSALLGTLFLAVGVGAIVEVLDELTRYARRRIDTPGVLLAGAATGFTLMYGTALMIGA